MDHVARNHAILRFPLARHGGVSVVEQPKFNLSN
jgi:hypothetical protein